MKIERILVTNGEVGIRYTKEEYKKRYPEFYTMLMAVTPPHIIHIGSATITII